MDDTSQDSSSDGNLSGEGALLVDVGTVDGLCNLLVRFDDMSIGEGSSGMTRHDMISSRPSSTSGEHSVSPSS